MDSAFVRMLFFAYVLVVIASGCSAPPDGGSPADGTGTAGEIPDKEFAVTARQWEFDPAVIRVDKGDRVRLRIKSADVTHGFRLDEYGIDVRIEPGDEVVVDFVADKEGTFEFRCSVFCGAGHLGMKGTLIVS